MSVCVCMCMCVSFGVSIRRRGFEYRYRVVVNRIRYALAKLYGLGISCMNEVCPMWTSSVA